MKNIYFSYAIISAVALNSFAQDNSTSISASVLATTGNSVVIRASETIPSDKVEKLMSGDILKTGGNGNIQFKLENGALISLRPDTEIKINNANFSKNNNQTVELNFEMNKGTIDAAQSIQNSTLNSSIKINAQNSAISAFNADFSLKVCSNNCKNKDNNELKDGIYGRVINGSTIIENQKGKNKIEKGESFYIKDNTSTPEKEKSISKLFNKNLVRSSLNTSNSTNSDATSRLDNNNIINNSFYFSESEQLGNNGKSKLTEQFKNENKLSCSSNVPARKGQQQIISDICF